MDVRTPDSIEHFWLSAQRYHGDACLAFAALDSATVRTSGDFRFLRSGSNAGFVGRRLAGVTDTLLGYVFIGEVSDGGTYTVDTSGVIALRWAGGNPQRIFNPPSVHVLMEGDSIASTYSNSEHGDSLRVSWRMSWFRYPC